MDFTLRRWNKNDLDSLVKYANNWNIARNLTDMFPYPYTRESGTKFIEMVIENHDQTVFAIDIGGEASGAIGIHPLTDIHKKNAELGYWLAEPFWKNGIMTRAVIQMIDFGFKSYPVNRIFARPFGSNIGSQKVLEKAGFKLEARFEKILWKKDRYEDELIYAIRRDHA